MPTAVRPGVVQDQTIRSTSKPVRLRVELGQPLTATSTSTITSLRLTIIIVGAVVLVVLKLRPHLLFQMVLRLINLPLQTVTGVVANEALLWFNLWHLHSGRFFVNFAQFLQTGRGPDWWLELVRQRRVLERLVALMCHMARDTVRREGRGWGHDGAQVGQ